MASGCRYSILVAPQYDIIYTFHSVGMVPNYAFIILQTFSQRVKKKTRVNYDLFMVGRFRDWDFVHKFWVRHHLKANEMTTSNKASHRHYYFRGPREPTNQHNQLDRRADATE